MTHSVLKRLFILSALAATAFGTQGCYIYSAFQGARTLDEGKFSVSPSASIVSFSNDGESSWMTTQYGARGGLGLGDRMELQSRFERVEGHREDSELELDDWGFSYLDIGLKYGVIPDRLAIAMPIGFMFGENAEEGESWQIHPSLFLTLPAASFLDINLSAKSIIFFEDMSEYLLAFNGGLGLRPGDGRLTLLPEMGMLISPGDEGHFWHWGMGASVEF